MVMKLILFLLFCSNSLASRHIRAAVNTWDNPALTSEGLELVFVSAVWRHGERFPVIPMPGDKATDLDWKLRGGAWGELTLNGEQEQYKLGQKLYHRYAENVAFLSQYYDASEVYVISTNTNRNIDSAEATLFGMYSDKVQIHTEKRSSDYLGGIPGKCPRLGALWGLVKKTKDYVTEYDEMTRESLAFLRLMLNVTEQELTFENLYRVTDNMKLEKLHFSEKFKNWYPFYFEKLEKFLIKKVMNESKIVVGQIEDEIIDGINVAHEFLKIRGGPLLNEIICKACEVIGCKIAIENECKSTEFRSNQLKFHGISSHDVAMGSFLKIMGLRLEDIGLPKYSSAIVIEFFLDKRDGAAKHVFRMLFNQSENAGLRVITPLISGCIDEFCPIEVLRLLAEQFSAPEGIEKLCKNTNVSV